MPSEMQMNTLKHYKQQRASKSEIYQQRILWCKAGWLTLKEPGYFDPSHSRRGADSAPPLRSWKPIDETSSVWY